MVQTHRSLTMLHKTHPPTPKSVPEKNKNKKRYPAFIDFCVSKAGIVYRR